jgi:hypothetical protein
MPPAERPAAARKGRQVTANSVLVRQLGAQARLQVGPAGDPLEREADVTAAAVMRAIRLASSVTRPPEDPDGLPVARRVQRSAPIGAEGGTLDADTEAQLKRARGGGVPLPATVRDSMESAFGADFGGVRLHAGPGATELNERVQAKAFTIGSDIFFRDRMPDAGPAGQELLAHELTHTVQQGAAPAAGALQMKRSIEGVQRWSLFGKAKAPAADRDATRLPTSGNVAGEMAKPGAVGLAAEGTWGGTASHTGSFGGESMGAGMEVIPGIVVGDALMGMYSGHKRSAEAAVVGDQAGVSIGDSKFRANAQTAGSASLGAAGGGLKLGGIASGAYQTGGSMVQAGKHAANFAHGTALGASAAGLGIAGGAIMVGQGLWKAVKAGKKLSALKKKVMLTDTGEKWKTRVNNREKWKLGLNVLKVAAGALGIAAGALLLASNPVGWAIGIGAAVVGGAFAASKIANKISDIGDRHKAKKQMRAKISGQSEDSEFSVLEHAKKQAPAGEVDPRDPDGPKRKAIKKQADEVAQICSENARVAGAMITALQTGDLYRSNLAVLTKGDKAGQALPFKVKIDGGIGPDVEQEIEIIKADIELADARNLLDVLNSKHEEALSESGQERIEKKLSVAESV